MKSSRIHRIHRSIIAAACVALVAFSGAFIAFAATDSATNTSGVRSSQISTSGDTSILLDDNAATPEQAILALVDAENAADWEKVYYELSAYTAWNYEFVRADLASRAPKYSDFKILQTDFIQLDSSKYARVQVSYTLDYKDRATGEQKTISRPGDWWTVFTENGVWKVEYDKGSPGWAYNLDTPSDPDVVLDFIAQPSIHSIVRFAN